MKKKYQPDPETLDQVRAFVIANQRASISYIQRSFKIGFNQAAYLIDALEHEKVVSPIDNRGHRKVLINKMIDQKTWDEFRSSGMLWLANRTLHLFGWAICVNVGGDGKVLGCYPARCKFRGFSADCESEGFKNVARFVDDNSKQLLAEASE